MFTYCFLGGCALISGGCFLALADSKNIFMQKIFRILTWIFGFVFIITIIAHVYLLNEYLAKKFNMTITSFFGTFLMNEHKKF